MIKCSGDKIDNVPDFLMLMLLSFMHYPALRLANVFTNVSIWEHIAYYDVDLALRSEASPSAIKIV